MKYIDATLIQGEQIILKPEDLIKACKAQVCDLKL